MKNKIILRKLFIYFLLFLSSFFLFITVSGYAIQSMSKNPDFLIKQMQDSNYITLKTKEMTYDFDIYTRISGFDERLFDDLINEEVISTYTIKHIKQAFKNGNSTINYPDFKNTLQKEVKSYIENHDIHYNNELKSELVSFYSEAQDKYSKSMYIPYLNEIVSMIHLSYTYANSFSTFSLVSFLICIGILFFLKRKEILNYLAIIFVSLTAMLLTLPLYLLSTKSFINLDITPESFNALLSTSIQSILNTFVSVGKISVVISLALLMIVVTIILLEKYKEKIQ